MYTAFYELREKPFALTPDPRFLFLAQSHREALAHLLYGIDQEEGFIALTGEVGTGKTTLCRSLLERLGSDCEVAFLFNPTCSDRELLEAIAAEFGLEVSGLSRRELGTQLNRFLLAKKSERRKVLLIIDEAQNLSLETLEQVRLLSNLETSSSKLIQIVLLGQPELDRKLDSRELRQLRQRIGVRWSLQPLSRRETGDYVRHRLRVAAGAGRDIFTDAAVRDIHRRSGGIPRLVNVLCDRSLLTGFAAGQTRIRSSLVKSAAREIPDVRRRSARSAAPRYRRAAGWLTAGILLIALATVGLVAAGWDPGALSAAVRHRVALLVGDPVERAGASVAAASVAAAPPPVAATSESAVADVFEPRTRAASPEPEGDAGVEGARTPQAAGEETMVIVVPEPEALAATSVSSSTADLAPPATSLEPSPTLEVGRVLARVLDGRDAFSTRLAAVNSVLAAFGLPAYGRAPESDEAAVGMLRARGLTVLSLERTDFETLHTLNYPALLSLESELGDARLLAVRRLDDGRASLHGATGDGPLRLPVDEVEERWSGRAFVAWQDFESIPEVLALGERGSAVAWLQAALTELGCYRGEASGLFDSSTREGLRVFQRSRSLQPDGAAGPRTQMVLYDALGRYDVPRLREGGGVGVSTILKALRRLEREKVEERPPDLDRRVAAPESAARPSPGWIRRMALLVFCGLLGVGGGALLTWFLLPRGDAAAPSEATELKPVAAAPAFAGLEPEPRHLAMANPERVPAPLAGSGEPLRSSLSPEGRILRERLLRVPPQPSRPAPEPVARDLPPVAVLRREARPETGSATAVATEPAAGAGEARQEPEPASIAQPIQSSQVEKAVLAERSGREAAPVIVRKSVPEVIVKRTVWHPDSKRRVAAVQVAGHSGLLDLREGDSIEGLTVVEITPSGVSFDHGGVELYKRLGAGG